MRYQITETILKVGQARFIKMLKVGYFPKIEYASNSHTETYNMIEYSLTWSTFMKVLDKRMKEKNLDQQLGVFTRKRSDLFLAKVRELAEGITEADVYVQSDRFKTMWD